ncbi:MAG TPA: kelch repeat-containing protein [Candidatus Didemnitutus sp.]|nr:kelch repeat-containing protein [Candidatus Didemnitutus sp.]
MTDGDALYVVAGGGNGVTLELGSIERVDLRSGKSSILPVQILPRRFHGAALFGRKLVIVGGEGPPPDLHLGTVEEVDVDTLTVRTLTRMPTARRALSAVKVDNLLFTIGGSAPFDRENFSRSNLVEIWDESAGKWLNGPPMPSTKEAGAVLHGRFIYVLGGYDGLRMATSSCDRYDLTKGKWEKLGPVPFKLSAYSGVDIGRAIVCFGDYETIGQIAAYLPARDQWLKIEVPFVPRRHSAACRVGEEIYVVGGWDGQPRDLIERYSVTQLEAAIVRAAQKR